MSDIASAKKLANYEEPKSRQLAGCHTCARVQMQPSLSGSRAPYCSRLGCWVKEMAICKHYTPQAAKEQGNG